MSGRMVKVNFRKAAVLDMGGGHTKSYSMGTAIISEEEFNAYKGTDLLTFMEFKPGKPTALAEADAPEIKPTAANKKGKPVVTETSHSEL